MTTWFSGFDGTLRVGLSSKVMNTFLAHQQNRFWQGERGGVLFASSFGTQDGKVEVVEVSLPHAKDKSTRFSLKLDHERTQQEINSAFDRGLHFTGYWHTHPQHAPRLSGQDVASILPAVKIANVDLVRVLMVVVGIGRERAPVDLCAIEKISGNIERLVPLDLLGANGAFMERTQ